MKKDLKRVGIYGEMDLKLGLIKGLTTLLHIFILYKYIIYNILLYKIHHWATKQGGGHSFLGHIPQTQGGGNSSLSIQETHTHTDRYLDFNSSHPILAKRAVVRALMDWAENVCSDPDILAKEMEHLNRVLHYNNYPPISVPYFPGLSESYWYRSVSRGWTFSNLC